MKEKEKLAKRLSTVETTLAALYEQLKEINNDLESSIDDNESVYNSWIGKPVFVFDNRKESVRIGYLVTVQPMEEYPFRITENKTSAFTIGYRHCRLVKDFEDLLRGVW